MTQLGLVVWFFFGMAVLRHWGIQAHPDTIGILLMSGAVGAWAALALCHLFLGHPKVWWGARIPDRNRWSFLIFALLLHAGTALSREAAYVVSGEIPVGIRIVGVFSLVASALPFWLVLMYPSFLKFRVGRTKYLARRCFPWTNPKDS